MSKHDQIIDNFLKHYVEVKSPTSYSYLLDYFIRNGLANYKSSITKVILESKAPVKRYTSAFHSLYSYAINDKDHMQSFETLLNLNSVLQQFKKVEIDLIYQEVNSYLREGNNLSESEQRLYEIFLNSALKDIWDKNSTPNE